MNDRSQEPSTRYPMGVAACGTPITPELIVFTNEMKAGKVVGGSMHPHTPGWFDVRYANGRTVMMNATRVSTSFITYEGTRIFAMSEYTEETS